MKVLQLTTKTLPLYIDVPVMLCKWYIHYSCNMLSVEDVILDCLELYTKL